jgi:cobalamin synthase
LTIKPIRKAPEPTPMPVVDEPDYDNSNSKMLLIMAVGLVIGFLIATAIWK